MYKSAIAGLLVAGLIAAACDRPRQQPTESRTGTEPAATALKASVNDAWITTKIEAQYFADPDVKGRHIDVTTTNGVVALEGAVENERARQRAVEIARGTDGVAKVEDRLAVGAAPARTASGKAEERITSGWITTKIQAQYFADDTVKGRDIDVTSHNSVVTLNGRVDSDTARQRAVEIARRTDGVKGVEDNLRVEPSSGDRASADKRPETGITGRLSDDELSARIKAKYYIDENVRGNNIDVDTDNGVVTLSGSVDSEGKRRRAVNIARRTWGVQDVREQLRVEKPVATSGRRDTGTDLGTKIEDAWITTKIQSKFFIDDDVKGRNIDVTTNSGVVTLTGEVESNQARQQAVELARETDGVTRVVDRLKVAPRTAKQAR